MASESSLPAGTAASPAGHILLLGLAFSTLLVAVVLYPVTAFKAGVALLVPVLIWQNRLNAYLCVLMIPFLSTALFIIDPKAGLPFDQYIFGIWFLFLVARWSTQRRIPRLDAVDILLFVYVGIGLIYLVSSSNTALGYLGFRYDHRPLLVYLLLRATGSTEHDWRRVATFVLVLMVVILGDALYRYAFDYMSVFQFQVKRSANLPDVVNSIATYFGLGSQPYARLASIWMFAAALGPMLMVAALLLLGLRKLIADRVGKLAFVLLFSVVFVGLLMTYSRSGWIGLAVGTVVLVLLEENRALRRRFAKAALLFLGVAVATIVVGGFLSDQIYSRIAQLWTAEVGGGGHFYFLAISLAAIAANPLGAGLGMGFATQVGSTADVVWNESTYLRVGMEKGILPMLLLLTILALMSRRIYQRYKASSGNEKTFYQTAFAASIAILLINITFPYWESLMTHFFMFSAAYAINMGAGNTRHSRHQTSRIGNASEST